MSFHSMNMVGWWSSNPIKESIETLMHIPCLWILTVDAYIPSSPPSIRPYQSSASAAALAPARSIPSCSYHILATHTPGLHTVSLYRSRIGRVTMYYATVF